MRKPAWNGLPPRNSEQAKTRIIEAAVRCIDRYGPDKANLSDVAAELGVIRQTVYRYFPSTEELFAAVGYAARNDYVDRLVTHVAGITEPADLVVEAIAYTLEKVPRDPYLGLFLTTGRPDAFSRGATSAAAFEACRAAFARTDVDWVAFGYTGDRLTELIEFLLRVMLSFFDDPMPRRSGDQLRGFLRRWVASAVIAAPELTAPEVTAPQSESGAGEVARTAAPTR